MSKIISLLAFTLLLNSCSQRLAPIPGINFKESNFYYETQNKWISTSADAKQFLNIDSVQLTKPGYLKQLDSTYNNKAQYVFLAGGGCFTAQVKEMGVEIKHDTLHIIWNEPKRMCPPTGKRAPTNMCLEIDKTLYPNYKNFKIVLSQR